MRPVVSLSRPIPGPLSPAVALAHGSLRRITNKVTPRILRTTLSVRFLREGGGRISTHSLRFPLSVISKGAAFFTLIFFSLAAASAVAGV